MPAARAALLSTPVGSTQLVGPTGACRHRRGCAAIHPLVFRHGPRTKVEAGGSFSMGTTSSGPSWRTLLTSVDTGRGCSAGSERPCRSWFKFVGLLQLRVQSRLAGLGRDQQRHPVVHVAEGVGGGMRDDRGRYQPPVRIPARHLGIAPPKASGSACSPGRNIRPPAPDSAGARRRAGTPACWSVSPPAR